MRSLRGQRQSPRLSRRCVERFGCGDEATASYARALELRSDLPDARIGVRGHIRAGKLNDARALLDFMEKPGAAQPYSLEPLDTLAREFQKAERHEEALGLFAVIQKELPHMNEQRWFRDLIGKSEKALPQGNPSITRSEVHSGKILCPGNASTARTLLSIGIVLSVVALGLVISNEYIRRNRTLYIVNAPSKYATVKIPGVGEFTNLKGRDGVPIKEVQASREVAEGMIVSSKGRSALRSPVPIMKFVRPGCLS